MKEKLFKFLFPEKEKEFENLRENYLHRLKLWNEQRVILDDSVSRKEPSIADLYRDSVGLPMLDFVNVGDKGLPRHPFADLPKEQQLQKFARLNDVYMNEEFKEVLDYWTQRFGNHAIRNVSSDNMNLNAGIFSINGVSAIRKELKKANEQISEGRKAEDEFDENEVL